MNLGSWALFVVAEVVLCITPGPAVLFVLSAGLSRGGGGSLWANAGILAGNTFYFALSALGVGAALLASPPVFTIVKYSGAAYLIYLGVRTFMGSGLSLNHGGAGRDDRRDWRMLGRGFVLQVSNPKALMFFAALLPQFIDPRDSLMLQLAILGATSVVVEFVVLAAYGFLAARASDLAAEPRFVRITNCVSGGMLAAAGAGIALARRP